MLAKGRTTSLPKIWANGVGVVEFDTPDDDSSDWRCDPLGCVATVVSHGALHRVAFIQNAMAAKEDCAMSDVLVTMNNGIVCNTKPIIDGNALKLGGIHAIWFNADGTIKIRNASEWQKHRPWSTRGDE